MHGLIIEFRQIEDAGIKDWYKSTVSNVRQESIRVTDDISRSKRLKFYAAWMRYCSMIKTKNGQEDDSALKPSKLTFEEVTEKILSGKHISYDFKFMRGLVNLQLINIRELAE